jgi:DNA polymerase-3 subunit epsilon
MRSIVLDTETTGLDIAEGHKIIEIGCIELIDRKITGNVFHQYISPNRKIDEKASKVHGITDDFLKDKPMFSEIINDFLSYLADSSLIIHNAPFDIGFLKKEFDDANFNSDLIDKGRNIYDTLKIARSMTPGKRNSLDALCERYEVDNKERDFHGALLDAKLLAEVYLKMTMGQTKIMGLSENSKKLKIEEVDLIENRERRVIHASEAELAKHEDYFKK